MEPDKEEKPKVEGEKKEEEKKEGKSNAPHPRKMEMLTSYMT